MNPPQPRLIDNGNGHPLASHWYRPAGEPRGYLLIVPAMGVEQRFYAPFAAWLAERGYLAITFDYLGTVSYTHLDVYKRQSSCWACSSPWCSCCCWPGS